MCSRRSRLRRSLTPLYSRVSCTIFSPSIRSQRLYRCLMVRLHPCRIILIAVEGFVLRLHDIELLLVLAPKHRYGSRHQTFVLYPFSAPARSPSANSNYQTFFNHGLSSLGSDVSQPRMQFFNRYGFGSNSGMFAVFDFVEAIRHRDID
jgi:hypothetical protein